MRPRQSAERALVTGDPALPGLGLLLDDEALGQWLSDAAGLPVTRVRREYVRYKPGTSCVLAARVATDDGEVRCWFAAVEAAGAGKLAKTVREAPAGSLVAVDARLRLLAATPAADRDLPGLGSLAAPGSRRRVLRRLLGGTSAEVLRATGVGLDELAEQPPLPFRHKPQRRWVGRLAAAPVVLRAHRPDAAGATAASLRALAGLVPAVPELLGHDARSGLVAVRHAPGGPLDRALAAGTAGGAELAAAGELLARLHGGDPTRLARRPEREDVEAVRAAAAQLAVVRPDLGPRARALADRLSRALGSGGGTGRGRRAGRVSPVHGDFSADQAVVDSAGRVTLVDLDAAAAADPVLDLACAAAALAASTVLGDVPAGRESAWLAALHDGYATAAPLPDDERLAMHTAALLLRRAADPFRLCRPGWPEACEALLQRAEQAAEAGRALGAGPVAPAAPAGAVR